MSDRLVTLAKPWTSDVGGVTFPSVQSSCDSEVMSGPGSLPTEVTARACFGMSSQECDAEGCA